jgi:3-mercaptopyruvate sulfurtransferase SseA
MKSTFMSRTRLATGLCLVLAILASFLVFQTSGKVDYYFPLSREQAPNYHQLVSSKWVAELIDGGRPPTWPGKKYSILDVSTSDNKDYTKGHIPGAVLVRTDQIERAPVWNLVSNNELQEVIEGVGITRDSTVVVYCDDPSAGARILWMLMYAGVEDVRLLDGGFRSWERFGGQIETETNHPKRSDFGGVIPLHPEYLATLQDVRLSIEDPASLLVDVRSEGEFDGETSGYDYISAKGRIPSSIWGGQIVDLDGVEDVLNVKQRWTSLGLAPTRRAAFYCGTGWRSSLAFFYARLLGFENVRNFDGSWLEWSAKSNENAP